jgi:broad specificity phosphatase PhoE
VEQISVKTISRIATACLFLTLAIASQARGQDVRTIFLVRHADKISDAPDALLSEGGHRRAQCLAKMLEEAHIQQIYTSDLQRTQQTAAPLAERLKLKPVAIPLSQPEDLIEAIRSEQATNFLVVWHGGTLPMILHALGAPEVAPIADPEYDRFFILTLAKNEKHSLINFTVLRYCDREQ